jgi:hypothetical protein
MKIAYVFVAASLVSSMAGGLVYASETNVRKVMDQYVYLPYESGTTPIPPDGDEPPKETT